jgi:hypothetical protein
VEFGPGRGAIHLHIIVIARDKTYLRDFYLASTNKEKAGVLDKYSRKTITMTVNVNINDDQRRKLGYLNSPLEKRYCKCYDQEGDVRQLAEDCMCHQCNKFCLQSNKTNAPRTRQVHYGTESAFGKMDTKGLPHMPKSKIVTDRKGISHF